MSVIVGERDGQANLSTKGATEVSLTKCTVTRWVGKVKPLMERQWEAVAKASTDTASRALRVLALTYRDGIDLGASRGVEKEMVFAGIMGRSTRRAKKSRKRSAPVGRPPFSRL